MAQYTTGTVTVTNGSTAVSGTSTLWDSLLPYSGGYLFKLQSDPGVYIINSITDATNMVLQTVYQGTTASSKTYIIARDFTPNLNLPLIKMGDIHWPKFISDALNKIDKAIWLGQCGYIILEPQEEGDVPNKEGVLYIDSTSGRMRYHDGIVFRTLAHEGEDII